MSKTYTFKAEELKTRQNVKGGKFKPFYQVYGVDPSTGKIKVKKWTSPTMAHLSTLTEKQIETKKAAGVVFKKSAPKAKNPVTPKKPDPAKKPASPKFKKRYTVVERLPRDKYRVKIQTGKTTSHYEILSGAKIKQYENQFGIIFEWKIIDPGPGPVNPIEAIIENFINQLSDIALTGVQWYHDPRFPSFQDTRKLYAVKMDNAIREYIRSLNVPKDKLAEAIQKITSNNRISNLMDSYMWYWNATDVAAAGKIFDDGTTSTTIINQLEVFQKITDALKEALRE